MNRQDRIRIDAIKDWLKDGVDPDEIKHELIKAVTADVNVAIAELEQEKENSAVAEARRSAAASYYNYLAARGIVSANDPDAVEEQVNLLEDMFRGFEMEEPVIKASPVMKRVRPAATDADRVIRDFLKSLK